MTIAVVGAGVMGSCVAFSLIRRGHNVTLFDQFDPGHDRGSSHGHSRIVRKAYADPFYAQIMEEQGFGLWKEWESLTDTMLLHATELVYFGPRSSPTMQSQEAGLRANKISYVTLDRWEIQQAYGISLGQDDIAYVSKDGGWVNADSVVDTIRKAAANRGVQTAQTKIAEPRRLKNDFDIVVLAMGPWICRALDLPLWSSFQTVAYVSGTRSGPVWIEDGPNNFYGFPSEDSRDDFKIGVHKPGRPQEPDDANRDPDLWFLEQIKACAERCFGIASPKITRTVTCFYTNSSNEDFLIDWAEHGVLVVSPCSGHGFKFGPWIGEFVAEVIGKRREVNEYERFLIETHRANSARS